jgi:FAD:protein FMN transferase
MACSNEIVVADSDEVRAAKAMEAAAGEVLRIESKYSRYRADPRSIVHRINSAAGEPEFIECDQETRGLLNFAGQLFEKSDGLFDITSGILRRAWNFSKPEIPRPDVLQPLLGLIGWQNIDRSESGVRLRLKGMEIDFGGFGKEYAADRAAKVLTQMGTSSGYVNLGGDIRVVGPKPDGQAWLFGVQDPRNPGSPVAKIPISKGGLATSGDYEKYLEIDGKRYCHILNPKTGFPADCWRSVSISRVTTISAGGYATIAMLKESDAPAFLKKSNCAYFLVDAAGKFISSEPAIKLEK